MDRRRFLGLISRAVAGSAVAYSFPTIIVPKNISLIMEIGSFRGPSKQSFHVDWLAEAQREYIASVIDLMHHKRDGVSRVLIS